MMFLKAVSAARRTYPVITDGLKLYLDAYNLDSYSGSGSTWTDLSNSAYNITITGPTWTTSGGRRYFEFDGVNDYMVGNANTTIFDLVDGWTWSIWVQHVSSPDVFDALVESEYFGTTPTKLPYFIDNRNSTNATGQGYAAGCFRTNEPIAQRSQVNATVSTGVWYHVCATLSRTSATAATIKIYRDGSELKSETITLPSGDWRDNNNSRKPTIGAFLQSGTYSRFANIRVGEVLNYNRALSGTEVSNNYNSTKSNYGL